MVKHKKGFYERILAAGSVTMEEFLGNGDSDGEDKSV